MNRVPSLAILLIPIFLLSCGHGRTAKGLPPSEANAATSTGQGHGLAETVSPLDPSPNTQATPPNPADHKAGAMPTDTVIEQQIQLLRDIKQQIEQKEFAMALENIKQLEGSPVRQIAVRAKYFQGEALFHQEEFDLAMQAYKDIVSQHAFSGLALSALKRLILCSEKLELEEERKKYHSILHDFFEEEV